MEYSAQITIHEHVADVERLFASEEKEFANGRARYSLEKGKGSLTFKIEAQDPTALRAVLNSVAKMLAVFDKAKAAIEELESD